MVGSACLRLLKSKGYNNIIYKTSSELDLRNQSDVDRFIKDENPSIVINAAAKVGGIMENHKFPYRFLLENMQIQNNLISSCVKNKIKKFIFLGSSCIYPKFSPQPIKEEYLLTSSLEETNQWYAIAKISGVKLVEAIRIKYKYDYVSLMPTNLYGINDNFDLNSSHVLPAMIRKFHEAKIQNKPNVYLWGTGTPKREFLFVDDLANAVEITLKSTLPLSLYNVGCNYDISISDLALKIKSVVGYDGNIIWDKTKPDGTPRKLMDSSKIINHGFKPNYNLDTGIKITYEWFKKYFER